jgi:hypothetical protein
MMDDVVVKKKGGRGQEEKSRERPRKVASRARILDTLLRATS